MKSLIKQGKVLVLLILWSYYYVVCISCPNNDYSIESLEVSAYVSNGILSVSHYLTVNNGDAFNQRSGLLSLCIDVPDIGGRYCGLDIIDTHRFQLSSADFNNAVRIESSLCQNEGSECFCSAFTTVHPRVEESRPIDHSHFTVLSPQQNQTIATDNVLLFLQINSLSFALGSSGSLCIESIYRGDLYGNIGEVTGETESMDCFNSFPENVFHSINNSFLVLLDIPSGHWDIIVKSTSVNGDSVFQQETISLTIVRPEDCSAFSAQQSELQMREEVLLTDSTFYFDGVDDMMMIRLAEHGKELHRFIPVEANESHNGTARRFSLSNVVPQEKIIEGGVTLPVDWETLLSLLVDRSEVSKMDVQELKNCIGDHRVESWARQQLINGASNVSENDMAKECQQRDAVLSVLSLLKRPENYASEYLLVSDTDEVLHRNTLRRLRECKVLSNYAHATKTSSKSTVLPQFTLHILHHYMYNFNFKRSETWGITGNEGAYTVASTLFPSVVNNDDFNQGEVLTPTRLRRLFRPENLPTLIELAKRSNIALWKDSGWHMSAFKSPADYATLRVFYPGEKSKAFFTTEHCIMLQDLGLSAYELHRPLEQLFAESLSEQQRLLSDDELPRLFQYSEEFRKRFLPSRVQIAPEDRRRMIAQLQQAHRQSLPPVTEQSDIVFYETEKGGDNFLEYTVGCVLSPSDSIRRGDRAEIDRTICCPVCGPSQLVRGQVKCDSIYEYADFKCRLSSNDRVSLTVIVD